MSGYRPRPYRILNRTPRMVASAFRAVFSHSECDVCFVMIFIAHLSKNFLKFYEKTCQECVSEDIYRVKGIRVWVVAQATRQGRADIGTALLFPAVLPAVFSPWGRQGGGVSPARPVSFPRLRRGLLSACQKNLRDLAAFRIANRVLKHFVLQFCRRGSLT